jgi:hypothetical protein
MIYHLKEEQQAHRSRLSICYRTYNWNQFSRVKTRLKTVDFMGDKNQ